MDDLGQSSNSAQNTINLSSPGAENQDDYVLKVQEEKVKHENLLTEAPKKVKKRESIGTNRMKSNQKSEGANVYSRELQTIKNFCQNFISQQNDFEEPDFFGTIDLLLNGSVSEESEEPLLKSLEAICQKEVTAISTVLNSIAAISKMHTSDLILNGGITNEAAYQSLVYADRFVPEWMGSVNEMAPPMCGSIPPLPDHKVKGGDYVAAFVFEVTKEVSYEMFGIPGSWILAKVVKCKREKCIISYEQSVGLVLFEVKTKFLIPLPYFKAEPRNNPEAFFPKGSIVLALKRATRPDEFPNCFYPALVIDIPQTSEDSYTVRFREWDNAFMFGDKMSVPQTYVIKYRDVVSDLTERERKLINDRIQKGVRRNQTEETEPMISEIIENLGKKNALLVKSVSYFMSTENSITDKYVKPNRIEVTEPKVSESCGGEKMPKINKRKEQLSKDAMGIDLKPDEPKVSESSGGEEEINIPQLKIKKRKEQLKKKIDLKPDEPKVSESSGGEEKIKMPQLKKRKEQLGKKIDLKPDESEIIDDEERINSPTDDMPTVRILSVGEFEVHAKPDRTPKNIKEKNVSNIMSCVTESEDEIEVIEEYS